MSLARTVTIHVGPPKSGTTYVQGVMAHNRALLRSAGVCYPGDHRSHFEASLDLRGVRFKGHEYPGSVGAWQAVVDETRAFDGDALISHETLANAKPEAIDKAVSSFPDSEVRVLITCRDLGRQLPAEWQERVKNGNRQPYSDYLDSAFSAWQGTATGLDADVWSTQNLAGLAARWAGRVGAENVTLVTVPRPGAEPGMLWDRYSEAAGFPEIELDLDLPPANVSLGTAETEFLRRLNDGYFPQDLPWPVYEGRVKRRFVHADLSAHCVGGKLSVPEKYAGATEDIAAQMVQALVDEGYRVVGDLEELHPRFLAASTMPEDITDGQLLELALRILGTSVLRESSQPPQSPPPRLSGREAAAVLAERLRARLRRRP